MRSVDVDKIIDFCNEWERHFDYRNIEKVPSFLVGIWTVKEFVESLPILEKPCGMWLPRNNGSVGVICSECNARFYGNPNYKYCPCCGAKMGGDKE